MSTDVLFWDRVAEKYARRPVANEGAYQQTLERVRHYLRSEDRALELGCGTASTAILLSPHVQEIVATDLSQAMIDIGARKALAAGVRNLKLRVAEPCSAPEGPFDVVMAFNLFHLVPDLESALAAVHARLRPGGLFISKTPCLSDTRNIVQLRLMRLVVPLMQVIGKAPQPVHFLAIEPWQDQVRRAGFEILETANFPESPPNHFIVARRL